MVLTTPDIRYAVHDGVDLFGDFYRPEQRGLHPVLVAVPGGGWLRGDRKQLAHWAQFLAESGIAVFVVDYRRSLNGKIFPANARDVFAASRFIVGESTTLGIDPARLGLLGASAGAHLAALVALAHDSDLLAGSYPDDLYADTVPRFKALVGIYGVYNLVEHWHACHKLDPVEDDLVDRMLGASLEASPDLYRVASPSTHIHNGNQELRVFLGWGDADQTVSPFQSLQMAAELERAKFHVQAVPIPEAGHFWFSKEKDVQGRYSEQLAPALMKFLRANLL